MSRYLAWAASALFTVTASATTATCPEVRQLIATSINEGRLNSLFEQFDVQPAKQPVYFVTLDHRPTDDGQPAKWTAYRWKGQVDSAPPQKLKPVKDVDLTPLPVPRGDDGVPELLVGRQARVIFVLTNTTPQLYAMSKATTKDPIPTLDDLTTIINTFGQFMLAVDSRKSALTSLASVGPEDPKPLKMLEAELEAAGKKMASLASSRADMIRVMQYGEYGSTVPLPDLSTITTETTTVSEPFAKARTGVKVFLKTPFAALHRCSDLGGLAKQALDAIGGDSEDGNLRQIRLEIERSACDVSARKHLLKLVDVPEVAAKKSAAGGSLAVAKPKPGSADAADAAAAKKIEDQALAARKAKLELYIANVNATVATLTAAKEIDDAEFATAKTAVALQRLVTAPGANDPCRYTTGILFADSPDQITFDKIGTVKVTIGESSPFGATYDRRRNGTGERSFRIANPAARRIAIAVGGIYSPLSEPTYKAVADPLNADQKVITKVDESKRAGAVALLAAYRFLNDGDTFRPGIQFGVGFGSDPQVFTGFSLDLGVVLRLGIGVTGQQVRDLATGQHALQFDSSGKPLTGATVVANDDAIRLKQRFLAAPYLSLSISLDSLSLFKRPTS